MIIGNLVLGMRTDTSGLSKGFASARAQVGGFASSVGAAGGAIKAALATAGAAAMGAAILKVAGEAAHLNEAIAKTEQIFGDAAGGVVAQADKMNAAYGTARKEYLDGTAALGGQLQGVGYAEKDAAALSVQFAALAADAAAFRDVGFDEALTKIRAGLSGESEPLKAWGVLIDEAAVKTEALRMGLVEQGGEMDNAAKVQARMSLITKGLAKDSGALSRESTSTANQMAEFWGRLSTLGETVGGSFVDGVGGGLAYVNRAIAFGIDNWGVFSEAVVGVVAGAGSLVVGWMSDVAEFFGLNAVSSEGWAIALDTALGIVANGWQLVGSAFAAVSLGITSGVQVILGLLAKVGDAFDWVAKRTTGSETGIGDYLRTLEAKVKASTDRQAASLVEGWAKPWASEAGGAQKIKDAFTGAAAAASTAWAATGDKIQAAREALSRPIDAAIGAPAKAAAAAAAGAGKARAVGLMRENSAEAARTILAARYGGGANDPNRKVAANTAKAAVALDQLRQIGRETLAAIKGASRGPVPTISI